MRLLLLSFFSLFFFCCGREKSQETNHTKPNDSTRTRSEFLMDCNLLRAEAKRYDSTLLLQNDLNDTLARNAIKAFTGFASYCKTEIDVPIYLLKTASVAKAVNNIPQAKIALETLISDYPGFENRPAALFMLAQLYDEVSYLNDEHEAARLYKKIISDYPNSEWVVVAKGALKMIGKSDKEMLKEFTK